MGIVDWEWEPEINLLVNRVGLNQHQAETLVILRWFLLGNLRPLAAAIRQGHSLDQIVLDAIGMAIDAGELEAKPFRSPDHRTPEPGKFGRDWVIAVWYEVFRANGFPSEKAFSAIADIIGVSPDVVKKAVTEYRKK